MARFKFNFWLDGNKDDELLVAEAIDELKTRRSFSAVVRDGIMIVKELREGRVDLLLRLYPFVRDAILAINPPPPPTPPPMDMTPIFEQFRQYMAEHGGAIPDTREGGLPLMSGLMPTPKLAAGQGSIAGASRVMELPTFDDDDDDLGETMIIKKAEPKPMTILEGLLGIVDGGGLQGKNHTAEANAKALSGLRHH